MANADNHPADHPDVTALLPVQMDFIAGSPQQPDGEGGLMLSHPDTGAPLAPSRSSSSAAVEAAIAAADDAHRDGRWWDLGPTGRAAVLLRFADALEARSADLAVPESLNTGIPIGVTEPMTGGLAGFLHGAADRTRTLAAEPKDGRHGPTVLHRLPFGPVVVIAPWNAPSPTIVGRTAAALAAGCPVIVKPSEWAPGTADLVAQAAAEANLPVGSFQLVHGGPAVGAQLVSDPRVRVVSFTGGQPAGRAIAAAAAPNFTRLQLELGGNNPAIVCADADLDATAASLAAGMTKLNGQWCEAPGRIIVHDSIADELVERLRAELDTYRIGSCLDPATRIGPLSHQAHYDKVMRAVADLAASPGHSVLRSGQLPELSGWFVQPTIIKGLDPLDAPDEVFGPAVTVHAAPDDSVALAGANAGHDGLAGYVFSSDIDKALDMGHRIRAGEIKVNGTGLFDLCGDSEQSFWGCSGIGGHGDDAVFELFRGSRIVGVDNPKADI